MTATTLEPSAVPPSRLAHGYRWEDEQWKEEPALAHGSFGAMGGMLTSVRDLSRYVAVYMDAWPPRDAPETGPIRRASLREMQQLWRPANALVTRDSGTGVLQLNSGGYAFGLSVSQNCTFRHIVTHGGGLPGFGTVMTWLPEYGAGVVAFGNLTYNGFIFGHWNYVGGPQQIFVQFTTGDATSAAVQALIHDVTYVVNSDSPLAGTRARPTGWRWPATQAVRRACACAR